MPLPDNHPLMELARNVAANPDLWAQTVAMVRKEEFLQNLANSGQLLQIAFALFDASPLGPKPYGFLAGALAFEMADEFQDPQSSGNAGHRALAEPFNLDHLSLEVRCSICTRLLSRNTLGGDPLQRAELCFDRARSRFYLGDFNGCLSDCDHLAIILSEPLNRTVRRRASKLASKTAHSLYQHWLAMSLEMQREKASQGMFLATRDDLMNFERLGEKARKLFEIYFKLDGTDATPHAEYADLTTDRPELCVKHIEEALRLDQREPLANYMIGGIRREEGKLEEALVHFQRAVDGAPNDPWHHSELARTCFQLWRRKQTDRTLLDRAIIGYETAIRLQPENNDWLFDLVVVLSEGGKNKQALEYASQYLERDSSPARARQIAQALQKGRNYGRRRNSQPQ